MFKIYLKACKRLLDLDTLNGHLNIQSSNRDYIDTNLNSTKGPTKYLLYNDNLENNVLVDYKDFMRSRFHSLTSLPSQKSVVSNFGQHDEHKFWQMTTNSSFDINYDRDEMKPLKHQWNKMLGPISLSGVDLFSIQYDCINGNLTSMINIYSIYFIMLQNYSLRWRTMSTWLSWSGTWLSGYWWVLLCQFYFGIVTYIQKYNFEKRSDT